MHQTPGWIVASILLALLVVIGNYVARRRHAKKNVDRLLNINHRQITSTNPDRLSLGQVDLVPTAGGSLDGKIEGEFRRWLEQERNDGYRNLSEAYRVAFNRGLSTAHVRFRLVSKLVCILSKWQGNSAPGFFFFFCRTKKGLHSYIERRGAGRVFFLSLFIFSFERDDAQTSRKQVATNSSKR